METPKEQGREAAELSDEEAAKTVPSTEGGDLAESSPKPIPEELPEDGDSDEYDEEPIPESEFDDDKVDLDDTMDNFEAQEEPNDLSEIEKEFEE